MLGWLMLKMLTPVLMLVFAAIDGYVIAKLWTWHLMALGLPAISIPTAIVLVFVFRLLSARGCKQEYSKEEIQEKPLEFLDYLFMKLLYPWMCLLIGFWLL